MRSPWRPVARQRPKAIGHLRPDQAVALAAAREWSVLSVAELRGCSLSDDAIERQAHTGRLHRMYQGVYAIGHPNPPLEGRFLAAAKACGDGALLSHFSGAAHWSMVEWDDRRLEVTVPASGARHQPGVRVHRTKILEPRDVMRHPESR
jgi:hypothetical protein